MLKKRIALSVAAVTICAASLCGVSGCSAGQHQIVQPSQTCGECHSGDVQTYDVADPKGATEVNTTFTVDVTSSRTQIIVCMPTFTAQDGSKCTPVQKTVVNVSNGKAEVTVEPGVWAIAIAGDGSSTYKIVKASASSTNTSLSL